MTHVSDIDWALLGEQLQHMFLASRLDRSSTEPSIQALISALGDALDHGHSYLEVADFPNPDQWVQAIQTFSELKLIGPYQAGCPLVLDQNRLFFHRYYQYEWEISQYLRQIHDSSSVLNPPSHAHLRQQLDLLYPHAQAELQGVATALALSKRIFILSGGPGTGKTTTISHILCCALFNKSPLRIALCAPTGKAAARVQFSLQQQLVHLKDKNIPDDILHQMPQQAITLHRLLAQHTERSPLESSFLPYDLIIIDESSMLETALAHALLRRIAPYCHIIFVGDPNQLAAVGAGNFFTALLQNSTGFSVSTQQTLTELGLHINSDLTDPLPPLSDCSVTLTTAHRFHKVQTLSTFNHAILHQQQAQLLKCLRTPSAHLAWQTDTEPTQVLSHLAKLYQPYFEQVQTHTQSAPEKLFDCLDHFRVLTHTHLGPLGSKAINAYFTQTLGTPSSPWFPGRPILITENDYPQQLFNGDTGIALYDRQQQRFHVWFLDQKNGLRKMALQQLPAHETALAMTIHKSQGSEFETIAIVLSDLANKLLTQSLLYTASTRAKQKIYLFSEQHTLENALHQNLPRKSALFTIDASEPHRVHPHAQPKANP